ncbi:14215_t:CDS:2 [Entrophospora sp. SA101]|nr:14215_t:CDS:2 [Entrophospora sp. SA101]
MKNNIQKIQLAMSYEEKDEKNTIDELIKKWRSASQEAAELLHSKMPKRSSFLEYSDVDKVDKDSMTFMLLNMGVDLDSIKWNQEDECFEDQ